MIIIDTNIVSELVRAWGSSLLFPACDQFGRQQLHEARSGDPHHVHGHRGAPRKVWIRCTNTGDQQSSLDDKAILSDLGVRLSTGGKGSCYVNAAIEIFFKSNHAEQILRRIWAIRRLA